MHLSVVIPTFNRRSLVKRSVKSVLEQDHPWTSHVEIIVADDGSTDGTKELLKEDLHKAGISLEKLNQIKIIALPHSGDPGKTRNQGARASHAPLISFLDSDDYWLPGRLKTLATQFSDCELMLSPSLPLDEPKTDWLKEYIKINRGNTSSAVICREFFFRIGGFAEGYFGIQKKSNFSVGFEDYELWLKSLASLTRTGKKNCFKPIPNTTVCIEKTPSSIGSMSLREQMQREIFTLFKAIPTLPIQYWPITLRRIMGAVKAILKTYFEK